MVDEGWKIDLPLHCGPSKRVYNYNYCFQTLATSELSVTPQRKKKFVMKSLCNKIKPYVTNWLHNEKSLCNKIELYVL